ncbi:MAG: hypothetical protein ACR2MQ_13890 [Gemmatimonadaceae bacterium]
MNAVDLDAPLALTAATAAIERRLPLGDSVGYATALAADAAVWTQDADFDGLPGVKYFAKGG